MANLTVTIAETGTGLQGSQSVSDSTTYTIEGIISFYHFKGQAHGLSGTNNPIYDEDSKPTGAGDDKTNLAYLRITNLEDNTAMPLKIMISVGDDMYLNLAKNESFIFCPEVGHAYQCAEYAEGGGSTNPDIFPGGVLDQIIFENNLFEGKHYEVYGAFVD